MKLQDQGIIEVLETQMPERSEEHEDKSYTCQSYRTPEVFLVGKANRLLAGFVQGNVNDLSGFFTNRIYFGP